MGGRRRVHLGKRLAVGLSLAAALSQSLVPSVALAQSEPLSLIRDTEIEETL